jgi:hypothetical protein
MNIAVSEKILTHILGPVAFDGGGGDALFEGKANGFGRCGWLGAVPSLTIFFTCIYRKEHKKGDLYAMSIEISLQLKKDIATFIANGSFNTA